MRQAFAKTLSKLASNDERILLLTADLGFMVWESFEKKLPKQFFNVGVAEQNAIGMATGLAESGFLPFIYSIATFTTLRGYDFIRNGPVLHQLPVRLIGVGGGYEYSYAGHTHHALEDIATLRIQPGLTIVAPADSNQAAQALEKTYDLNVPIYYRLGKNDQLEIPNLNGSFTLGRANKLLEGSDILWITMGPITLNVLDAANLLINKGISSEVLCISSINPTPIDDIRNSLKKFANVITVESHYVDGGIGSIVAELIAQEGLNCRLMRKGINRITKQLGNQSYLDHQFKLDPESLANSANQLIDNGKL